MRNKSDIILTMQEAREIIGMSEKLFSDVLKIAGIRSKQGLDWREFRRLLSLVKKELSK